MTSSPDRRQPPARKALRALMLRAMDANANRLREGLRVAEDLARFVLEDPASARRLKALRHKATASMLQLGLGRELLASRDSAGDLGRKRRAGQALFAPRGAELQGHPLRHL
jgi:hypothetical protein